ncbi:MAG: hypothetical protein RIC03_16240 [Cyclobacteriaceae bacterium]
MNTFKNRLEGTKSFLPKPKFLGILLLTAGLANLSLKSSAQIPLTVKSLDEDALLKDGIWRIVDAGMENDEPFISYAKLNCDIDRTSTSITYKSKNWEVNRLFFDKQLNFQRSEEKSYATTRDILKEVPIWGNSFTPTNRKHEIGGTISTTANAYSMPQLTTDFIDEYFVMPTINVFSYNLSTTKVEFQTVAGGSMVGFSKEKITPEMANQCWQIPIATVTSTTPVKSEKGQRWIANLSNPIPGGGHALFATSGVINELGKVHYIFKSFDTNGEDSQEVITFDYMPFVKSFVLDSDQPQSDYVIIATGVDYKDKSGVGKAEPLATEYLRVDGKTLKVKERFTFQSATTMWMVEKAIEKDGAVYLMGPASSSTSDLIKYTTPRTSKSLPNYQVAKITRGKAEYVSSFGEADLDTKKVEIESKGRFESSVILYPNDAMKAWVKDGKVYLTGQQVEVDKLGQPSSFGALTLLIVGNNGALEGFYGKPESALSRGDIMFSKDGNNAYWTTYDYKPLNSVSGILVMPKKYSFIASELSLTKIDLSSNKIVFTQICGEGEFAPVNGKEVLFDSETHVAINALSLAKKAKVSDITLVMFEK